MMALGSKRVLNPLMMKATNQLKIIPLFFEGFWTSLMVFILFWVTSLMPWNCKSTCGSMPWNQGSPKLKKMSPSSVLALIHHHRLHHPLSLFVIIMIKYY
ncbi:hypothetical protein AAZX31_02G176800 [Glycine max]